MAAPKNPALDHRMRPLDVGGEVTWIALAHGAQRFHRMIPVALDIADRAPRCWCTLMPQRQAHV